MDALLFLAFFVFVWYVFTKGVLPFMSLKYLIRRAQEEPRNELLEDVMDLDTEGLDEEIRERKAHGTW